MSPASLPLLITGHVGALNHTSHLLECAATFRLRLRHSRDTRNRRDCHHAATHSNTSTAHPTSAAREPTATGASLSRHRDASQTDNTPCHADLAGHSDQIPLATAAQLCYYSRNLLKGLGHRFRLFACGGGENLEEIE